MDMIKVLAFLLGLSVPVSLQVGTGLPAGIGSLILVVEALLFIYLIFNLTELKRVILSFNALTFVILFWLLMSFMFSPSVSQTLPAIKTFISSFCAGAIMTYMTFQRKSRRFLFGGFLIGCVICSIVAFGFSLAGVDRGMFDYSHAGAINSLSILIGLGIILVATTTILNNNAPFTIIAIGILFLGLVSLESRGAIIATIVSLLYVTTAGARRSKVISISILLVFGLAVVSSLFLSEVDFLDRLGNLQDVSRSTIWSAALNLPLQQYIFGGGIGSSPLLTGLTLGRDWSAHNVWIQMLLELGIIGTVACAVLMFRSISRLIAIRNWKTATLACSLLLFLSTLGLHFLESPVFWFLILVSNNRKLERFQLLKRS